MWLGPFVFGPIFGNPPTYVSGSVRIFDSGEFHESDTRYFRDIASLRVATGGVAIPEPSGLFLLTSALAAMLAMRRALPLPLAEYDNLPPACG